jgi:phenylpropionate dioxygenase-like ring-hydroxylating dioxygenase large terminal subunit
MTLLGEPILIGRRTSGAVFAFIDLCPHRGMPLRFANFDGAALRCCYHGWKFDTQDGRCIEIPCLDESQAVDPGRFGLRAFPCREVQGNIWVFVPSQEDPIPPPEALPPIPTVPGFRNTAPQVSTTMHFPCHVDQAAIGFFDPTHPPFVHTSRWWKTKPEDLQRKEKQYEPTGFGFRMARHPLKGGANPYRLLGRNVTVEVTIELPGIRIEHIQGDRHAACVLAAATPLTKTTTEVHYCLYWTPRWLAPFRPAIRYMSREFLRQDRDVAAKLSVGLAYDPPSMLLGDPDAQIKWYLRLKKEFQSCTAEQRPFVNPLQPKILRWRS